MEENSAQVVYLGGSKVVEWRSPWLFGLWTGYSSQIGHVIANLAEQYRQSSLITEYSLRENLDP